VKDGLVAQWSEQSTHNALVVGSSPTEPTTLHWMVNAYSKHTQLTQEDIAKYFLDKKTGQDNIKL
jgi:hypothetical protein